MHAGVGAGAATAAGCAPPAGPAVLIRAQQSRAAISYCTRRAPTAAADRRSLANKMVMTPGGVSVDLQTVPRSVHDLIDGLKMSLASERQTTAEKVRTTAKLLTTTGHM